jgi:hypothetical protein
MTPRSVPRTRRPRRASAVVTAGAAVMAAANTLGVVVLLAGARWAEAGLGAVAVLAWYWFALGAWRRTPWGLASPENAPPGPPALSSGQARAYAVTGAACVGALAVAVALQAAASSR